MTTPPPGPSPDDDRPPADQWPTGPPPPQSYPYPPGGPPPGYPYGSPTQPTPSRIAIGMVFAGTGIYFAINLFVGLAVIGVAGSAEQGGNAVLAGAAVMLALIAFGGGAGLLVSSNRYAKGLGLGLMIGWALVSLFSVGFCTGINPTMYTAT